MSHVSYTDLRKNLAKYMDEVSDSRAPLHITRQNARSVIMMSERGIRRHDRDAASVAQPGQRRAPACVPSRPRDAGKLEEACIP